MSAFSSIEAFYADDERRRRSRELDFGVWWRWRGVQFRVTWVADTGELIAVQLSAPRVQAIPLADKDMSYAGLAIIGGDPTSVYVLAIVEGEETVEELLIGWAEVCGEPDSLAWVMGRAAAPPLHERIT